MWQCKWRHLMANIETNASGTTWWPNLWLIQEAPTVGQIYNLYSQVPQPILRNGLGERSPPERVIFLQRLLAPSICIAAPYLHTFLNSAGCQDKLLPWQHLRKSIQLKARADLVPPPVCQFATTSLSVQISAYFNLDFSPFSFCICQPTYQELPNAVSWLRALILNCICAEITLVFANWMDLIFSKALPMQFGRCKCAILVYFSVNLWGARRQE